MATIPTLWETTKTFMSQNEDLINRGKDGLLAWLTDDGFETYNGCHFWSNFEVKKKNLYFF